MKDKESDIISYNFNDITIVCDDCLHYMRETPDNYFDLAVVDPDYGLDSKISSGGTWASKYKGFDGKLGGVPTKEYFDELFRVSKNQIIWGGNYFIDMLYPTRCYLIWDKKARMSTLADCEFAWTSFDRNAKIFSHCRNTKEKRVHICQKPIALYEWIYINYSDDGARILDTHLGSGSSAIAAYNTGRSFVGIEINPQYYDVAKERIIRHLNELRMF